MIEKEFSIEQSEELIANLKFGQPSEFEHLRSALNLLAHVPEISPVATPPILPSTISQPLPVIPVKSSHSRRTIITSIIVMALFASGSLAAAAVTGIGPSIIVNAGHSAAKFVKNVVGGAGNDEASSNSDLSQKEASGVTITSTTQPEINSNSNEDGNQNDSEKTSLPLVSKLIPPLSATILATLGSNENESQTSSHDGQGQNSKESQKKTPKAQSTQSPNEDQNQSESHSSEGSITSILPTPEISILPTPLTLPTGSSDDSGSNN